uniref:Uncharacterized protein n=1 Tax=Chenopodium quinoa TaxID=63459 RepID=A0A803MJ99_CHEQI
MPTFKVKHLPFQNSDHAPILLEAGNYFERGKKGKLFRFEAMWLSREECSEVVANAWRKEVGADPHMRILNCSRDLTKWAATTFGSLKKKIRKVEAELGEAQSGRMDTQTLHKCVGLSAELDELRRLEESYWFARSRANDLRDGDQNTSYFHRKASQRKKRNYVNGLYDKHDVWQEEQEKLHDIVSDYFSDLFETENPSLFDEALAGLETKVSEVSNARLEAEPRGIIRASLGEVFGEPNLCCVMAWYGGLAMATM